MIDYDHDLSASAERLAREHRRAEARARRVDFDGIAIGAAAFAAVVGAGLFAYALLRVWLELG